MDEEAITDASEILLGAIDVIGNVPEDDWIGGDALELGHRLDRLRVLMGTLREIAENVEAELAAGMTENEMRLPGVGLMRRARRQRWTWRYDGANDQLREDLRERVAMYVAMDVATGEVDPMKRQVAVAALNEAYDAIPSFSTLKKAGERRLKLRIEDYRMATPYYAVEIEEAGLL